MLRFKKQISVAVSIAFVTMLLSSCSEKSISEPLEKGEESRVELAATPGRLHNEILAEMNRDGCLTDGSKIERDEFISKIASSGNAVFRDRGIDVEVTEDDIRIVLECFDGWKEKGVFDVYAPIGQRSVEDVYALLDHLEADEGIDPAQIGSIRTAIEEIEAIGFSNCDKALVGEIVSAHRPEDLDSELGRALDILESSYDFWAGLKTDVEINVGPPDTETSGTLNPSDPEPILATDWWSIKVLLWDAVGALLCWYLGPVSVLCAVAASAAYIIATTGE